MSDSTQFTSQPFFMDSFDHLIDGSELTYKYHLDKDLGTPPAPNPSGAVPRDVAENVTISRPGRISGGCALFSEGGRLGKSIPGQQTGGVVAFAFLGTPKQGSADFGFIRIFSESPTTQHSLEWTGTGFKVWSGNFFEPLHFLQYPEEGEFPVSLNEGWNTLVFGAQSGEIHIPGAFSGHYLRINGVVIYEARGQEGDTPHPYYIEIQGNEGWKIDDLWMSWEYARRFGGNPNDPNDYLPILPVNPHIFTLKANGDNNGDPGDTYNDYLLTPETPLGRHQHIGGQFPDVNSFISSPEESTPEIHTYEDIASDLHVYAIQTNHLMRGLGGPPNRVYGMQLIRDNSGSPQTFGLFTGFDASGFGFNGFQLLSGNEWQYFTGCQVNDDVFGPKPFDLCAGPPWNGDRFCHLEFNPTGFGVMNSGVNGDGGLIEYAHGIIEVMTDSPPIVPPIVVETKEPWTHHRFTKLWKMIRPDGIEHRFTNHNMTLIHPEDGLSYTPINSLVTSAHQRRTGIDPNNSEIRGAFGTIAYNDFLAGKYNGTKITEYILDWRYPWAGVFLATTFYIDSTEFDAAKWTVATSGVALPLLRPKGHLYGRSCRHTLGDLGCKVDLALLVQTASVLFVGLKARTSFTTFDLTQTVDPFGNPRGVSGYWAFGSCNWTSGANVGIKSEIRSQTIGIIPENSDFVLQIPTPFPILAGDQFTVSPGCDKIISTCIGKFQNPTDGDVSIGNLNNYGGFPTIPGEDGLFAPLSEAKHVVSFSDFFDNPLLGLIGDILL